ncbi:hypothetical protein H5410_036681 [Solanum commersonii]|uniref:Uncharacterized protein n=1 Tax=Solanum commersonii TaxID=4109 RepID=A0A9J5Y4Y9_SOLCO|nr:hypothetical protein H5410_036681 [Solanum commersonii]
MWAKSISNPTTNVATMIALSHPSTHSLFASPATRVGSSFLGAGTNSELDASSDEAACSFWPNTEADLALDLGTARLEPRGAP